MDSERGEKFFRRLLKAKQKCSKWSTAVQRDDVLKRGEAVAVLFWSCCVGGPLFFQATL